MRPRGERQCENVERIARLGQTDLEAVVAQRAGEAGEPDAGGRAELILTEASSRIAACPSPLWGRGREGGRDLRRRLLLTPLPALRADLPHRGR